MKTAYLLLLSLLILSLTACDSLTCKRVKDGIDTQVFDAQDFAHPTSVRYAEGFNITQYENYTQLVIFNRRGKDTLQNLILYPKDSLQPKLEMKNAQYIGIPLDNIACSTMAEVGALTALGLSERLIATISPRLITDSLVIRRLRSGRIANLGDYILQDVDLLITIKPDAYTHDISSYDDEEVAISKATNIIYFNNEKEPDILGRAEWIKVIGLLYGRNAKADSVFTAIERRYTEARQIVARQVKAPILIMYGRDSFDSWFVPGENSYVAQLLRDAGLIYETNPGTTESAPKTTEYIYAKYHKAKLWLNQSNDYITTLGDFVALNERYKDFEAVRSGEVWVNRKRVNNRGGNDIWESGVYNPDKILLDLIKIAHPELLPNYETFYWNKLK